MSRRTTQHASLSCAATAACAALLSWFVSPLPGTLRSRAEAAVSPQFHLIVHPSNALTTISAERVSQVFLKRTTRWENGVPIRPVDLRPDSGVRREFSDVLLKRSVSAVRSYWQQRIFSGRELPPPEFDSDEEVLSFVARSAGAIGYVSASPSPSQAKVLLVR